MPGDSSNTPKARAIQPRPVISLLLERRSLVVTSDDLYCAHLHGIDAVAEDNIAAHGKDKHEAPFGTADTDKSVAVRVANWDMLGGDDAEIVHLVREGGALKRGTRTSLTCRAVEKVAGSIITGTG